jgi:hypothetical protein
MPQDEREAPLQG